MKARNWHKVGYLGELQDDHGNSLVYGEFGDGTYGLYTVVDGHETYMKVASKSDAERLLEQLAGGWRPKNWPYTEE